MATSLIGPVLNGGRKVKGLLALRRLLSWSSRVDPQGKRLSWRYAACKTIREEPARSEVVKAVMRAVRAVRRPRRQRVASRS